MGAEALKPARKKKRVQPEEEEPETKVAGKRKAPAKAKAGGKSDSEFPCVLTDHRADECLT